MTLIEIDAQGRGTCDVLGCLATYAVGDRIVSLPEGVDENGIWTAKLFCLAHGSLILGGTPLRRNDTNHVIPTGVHSQV